jgi:hypothetical protein
MTGGFIVSKRKPIKNRKQVNGVIYFKGGKWWKRKRKLDLVVGDASQSRC